MEYREVDGHKKYICTHVLYVSGRGEVSLSRKSVITLPGVGPVPKFIVLQRQEKVIACYFAYLISAI